MATALTFTSLQVDLRSYIERGGATDPEVFAQIPRIITKAEKTIAQAIKVQGFLVPYNSGLVAGRSTYPKPDRWRETVSMNFGTAATAASLTKNKRKPIFPRSYEYCRSYWPDSDATDVPKFYADYTYDQWLIVPTPVESYPWEINLYQLPPLLGNTVQTNWLTEYAPVLLLYRCLLDLAPFLKNDERLQTWMGLYQEQLSIIDQQDLQKVADRAAVRNEA